MAAVFYSYSLHDEKTYVSMISISYTLVPPNSSGFMASTELASPQTTFPPLPIRTVQTTAAATMPATGGKPNRNHFHHPSLPLLSQSTTLPISDSKSALLAFNHTCAARYRPAFSRIGICDMTRFSSSSCERCTSRWRSQRIYTSREETEATRVAPQIAS